MGANVTDQELAYRGLNRKDFNMQVGQSKLNNHQLFANIEVPLNDNWKVYTFGGYSFRHGTSGGFTEDPTKAEPLRDYTRMDICRRSGPIFRIFLFLQELKETGKAGMLISAIRSDRILLAMI